MLTLDQWKNIRRVDHVTLPGFSFRRGFYRAHARYRDPNNRPDLKFLDAHVQACHTAKSDWDRMTALGDILAEGSKFVAGRAGDDRYATAVNVLHNHALRGVADIVGNGYQKDVEDFVTRGSPRIRRITVNLFIVTPVGGTPSPYLTQTILDHVLEAYVTPAFLGAGVLVHVPNREPTHLTSFQGQSITLAGDGVPENVRGKIHPESPNSAGRLIRHCNSLGGGKRLDVAYVPDFEISDVAGKTNRAGKMCGGVAPTRPIIMINANPSQALADRGGLNTTLAHEFGHAICGCGEHSTDPNCLMADGNNRNGKNEFSLGQRAWFACNEWVT